MAYQNKKCPECNSEKVVKERIMGAQSGDLECIDCGFSGCSSRFKSLDEATEKHGN